jgi:DNA-binding transcriptional LysR family regulator
MTHRQLPRLPSMAALTSFESVARSRSVAGAARELHLTASAVSKQLRELEQQLGCRLFVRTTRGLQLTPEGADYHQAIAPLLTQLEDATLRLRTRGAGDSELEVGAAHSLGNRWLIPRLASFYTAHPDIRLNLTTFVGVPSMSAGPLQCALAYCERPPAGCVAEHVMRLRLYPVIASQLVGAQRKGELADLLLRHPLLGQHTLPDAWPAFLRKLGLENAPVRYGPRYQLLTMGLQAALSGLGIALLPLYVAQPEIDASRARRLGDLYLETAASYQLIYRKTMPRNAALAAFSAWVRAEGRRSEAA